MVTIYIEDAPYEVKEGANLLQAILGLGFDLPYFCWHPALGSVGACRQCAVKQFRDEKDQKGMIVMACMTPAAEGMRISIEDPEVKEFRAQVIDWLMTNHPHDCPVCDEGGECHLQDMTVMTGHTYREFRFKKRTFRNQHLGPFLHHEMNRCIQCYRCVRFYHDYAGGKDLNCFASRNRTYFGRSRPGVLQSPFSGNLVEICPTGVFTDKTLKGHYTRKWDLQTAPSLCTLCGVGCNVLPGERYGTVRRILNRYNSRVNGYFLCDRGRFGYEFVNSKQRIRFPRIRRGEERETVSREEALLRVHGLFKEGKRVIGIGSPRATLEANFLLRALVGPQNFFNGMAAPESKGVTSALRILQRGPAKSPCIGEMERADAVLVLGEDLTQTAPRLDLALRQAARRQPMKKSAALNIPDWNDFFVRLVEGEDKGPLFIASPASTALDHAAADTFRAAPENIARLGFAVAHEINEEAPPVEGLSDRETEWTRRVSRALKNGERPMVIAGLSSWCEDLLRAAANIAWALGKADREALLCFTMPECNTLGVGLLEAGDLEAAVDIVERTGADGMIVLENDLFSRMDEEKVSSLLDKAGQVVVLDYLENGMTDKASVVLPSTSFAECGGTLVNSEGRAQLFYPVFAPKGYVQASWRWLRDMLGTDWRRLDEVRAALAYELPAFNMLKNLATPKTVGGALRKVPRQSHRYSGRTAMRAHKNVNEPVPPQDLDTPLAYSMEGTAAPPPSQLIPRYWSPGWNSVQALNKFQSEVGGPLRRGDPGIRLIEPLKGGEISWFRAVPEAVAPVPGEWRLVPLYHIFGSEPLSLLTPGVAERAPSCYLALGAEDAEEMGANEGEEVEMAWAGKTVRLPMRIVPGLPKGVAGLPAGIEGVPLFGPDDRVSIARVS